MPVIDLSRDLRSKPANLRRTLIAILASLVLGGYPAIADTVDYSYDLRGRLVKADFANGGDTYTSSYSYDAADNRKTAKVVNSGSGNQPYIVVPGGDSESMSTEDSGSIFLNVTEDSNSVD